MIHWHKEHGKIRIIESNVDLEEEWRDLFVINYDEDVTKVLMCRYVHITSDKTSIVYKANDISRVWSI